MVEKLSDTNKTALIVLMSDGTKLPVIWRYTQTVNPNAYVCLAVSNKENSRGFTFAQDKGINYASISWDKSREPRELYSDKLGRFIIDMIPHDYLIISAGQPYILTNEFLDKFDTYRLINSHPGLLPDNPKDQEVVLSNREHIPVLKQVYNHDLFRMTLSLKLRWAGVTVHYMTRQVDSGKIIIRSEVPVLEDDTVKSLADRVHKREDEILPQAIDLALGFKK